MTYVPLMHVNIIKVHFEYFVSLFYTEVGQYIDTQASVVLPVVGLVLRLWSDDRFDAIQQVKSQSRRCCLDTSILEYLVHF